VPAKGNRAAGSGEFLVGFAPGMPPEQLREGQAKRLEAGSDIVFQMHYTASGKPARDRSRLGIVFASEEPKFRVLTLGASNNKFAIPPQAANHRVEGSFTLRSETELLALMPHMHLRGKAFEMRAVYPTGETEKLLSVPRYDFNWQLWYQLPIGKKLPKGTRIEATGWFDNSRNNKFNPDPDAEVKWGDQSWEEMMIGFFNVAIPVGMDPNELRNKPEPPRTGGE
jgi:hypothetical protein